MLRRVEHDNGVVTYQSPMLEEVGVPHGFSTRLGGVSQPPYDKLNLASLDKGAGDHNANVSENFRRLRAALGLQRYMRMAARQVHGSAVWQAPNRPTRQTTCADAITTEHPRQMLTIRTADCVPILLASAKGDVVAAVHAGWRGIVAGVLPRTLERLEEMGVDLAGLRVAVGPCIGVGHFEVGPEVAEAFRVAGLTHVIQDPPHHDGPVTIDLRRAVECQLTRVPMVNVDATDRCTYRDETEFFSHRRDVTHRGQSDTGRMAAVIATRSA